MGKGLRQEFDESKSLHGFIYPTEAFLFPNLIQKKGGKIN
jgi:hypothetical protein